MARRRRRSRAKENPLPLLPFLLLLGGAAAAVGTGVYIATRPKAPTSSGLTGGGNGGGGPLLQTGQIYTFGGPSSAGMPGTPQALADSLATHGWANIAVFYYAGQGEIPPNISGIPNGGWVVDATWMDPPTPGFPGFTYVPGKAAASRGLAINWGGDGHGGIAGGAITGGSAHGGGGGIIDQANGALQQGQNAVNSAFNSAQNAVNQGQNAINSAQNAVNNAQDTANNAWNQIQNTSIDVNGSVNSGG